MAQANSSTENNTMKPCHICNVDVPKPFIVEHMGSSLHNINSQIIDKALEKSQDHLKENYPFKFDADIDVDEEYCDTCNISYTYEHKLKHKASERHKKMVVYEMLLPKMSVLINDAANNLDIINEIKHILNEDDELGGNRSKPKENSCEMIHCDICKVCKTAEGYASHLKSPKHKKKCRELKMIEPPDPVMVIEKTYCDICDIFKNTASFPAHCKSGKHLSRLSDKVLTENHMDIYIIDGLVGEKHCKVCTIDINEAKTQGHVTSKDHMDRYKILIQNYNIIKVGKDYFCPVCDGFDDDVVKHILDKHCNQFLFDYEMFCLICRIKLPKVNMKMHSGGKLHLSYLNNIKKRSKPFQHIDICIEDDDIKDMVTVDSLGLKCRVCELICYEYTTLIKHFDCEKHLSKAYPKT